MDVSAHDVILAAERLKAYLPPTPLIEWQGFYFKAENKTPIGAFKIRGALNTLLAYQERTGKLPLHVCAFSSGNHALAVAYAAQLLKIKATIFIPSFASAIKIEKTRALGAEVHLFAERQEVEDQAHAFAATTSALLIPPYDHPDVIAGQGTATYEALAQMSASPAAIIAPCGGGGLLSGTFLAAQTTSILPHPRVIGVEPLMANDAARSLRAGKIFSFAKSPPTIADGARTLFVSDRTFHYLKQLYAFYEISEEEIKAATIELQAGLSMSVEPTSAMTLVGARRFQQEQRIAGPLLLILSGGNC